MEQKKIGTAATLAFAALSLWVVCASAVSAAEPVVSASLDSHAEIGQPFARVLRIAGDVSAMAVDSSDTRHLKAGDVVKVGDHLQSSSGGEALLQETDGGMLALRPSSELWIESYLAEGKSADHAYLRVVTGGARFVTGWIGHVNQPGVRILTPSATITVRGTDHEVYVVSQDIADASHERVGTYDKVNAGATALSAGNQDLALNSGHVGFVAAARPVTGGQVAQSLPVLLDQVPSFFAAGGFDAELEKYARDADRSSNEMLQRQLSNGSSAAPPAVPAACQPGRVGRDWLHRFDAAEARHESSKIIALFADDATITSTVRSPSGEDHEVSVNRETFVANTAAALKVLKNFQQQRLTEKYASAFDHSSESCPGVIVTSRLSERGEVQGRSFNVEALETYVLELRHGKWIAVSLGTVQQ